MSLDSDQIKDVTQIMGIDSDMLALLPKLINPNEAMNPWVEHLPEIIQQMNLKSGQVVLDLPCGTGRVSVPIAKAYKTEILGFDLLPAYIESAQVFAHAQKVESLCAFSVEDVRAVVERQEICDLLLWIAPPQIWQGPRDTVGNLRRCVRPGGHMLIGDAYLVGESAKIVYPEFEVLTDTTSGYCSWGDELVRLVDYKDALWEADYRRTRGLAMTAMKNSGDKKEIQLIRRYLESLAEDEMIDKEHLGLAICILKIQKQHRR